MNDLSEMWPIYHTCPYWVVCEPPYNCKETEKKYQTQNDETGSLKGNLTNYGLNLY